jgi:hypothetical protein
MMIACAAGLDSSVPVHPIGYNAGKFITFDNDTEVSQQFIATLTNILPADSFILILR